VEGVLFVCVHNAGRSQIAQGWFELLARPDRARAESAGSSPLERVHPLVAMAMREVGVDVENARPRKLTKEILERAQIVVSMGCGEVLTLSHEREVGGWTVEDPHGKPLARVREIRDEVGERVRRLLASRGWLRDAD
jgi:arsenate reductase (thioredoxin)